MWLCYATPIHCTFTLPTHGLIAHCMPHAHSGTCPPPHLPHPLDTGPALLYTFHTHLGSERSRHLLPPLQPATRYGVTPTATWRWDGTADRLRGRTPPTAHLTLHGTRAAQFRFIHRRLVKCASDYKVSCCTQQAAGCLSP